LKWSAQKELALGQYQARMEQMNADLTHLAVETNFAQRIGLRAVQTSESTPDLCQTAPWRAPAELKACEQALQSFNAINPPALKPKLD